MIDKKQLRSKFHSVVFPKLIWGKQLDEQDRNLFVSWKKKFNPPLEVFNFYKDKRILFEIVKYLKNNELCFGENIRWLYCSKIEYLQKVLFFYKVLERKGENKKGNKIRGFTFYRGLMKFSRREQPPFNPKKKNDWQTDYWSKKNDPEYAKACDGYNFGLDIDGKDIEDAYKDAKKVFKFFKKFDIKFSVWSSGKKGWHFIIPYDEFKNRIQPFNLSYVIDDCKGLMMDLVAYLKLQKVDTSIYSPTRYLKCPYTLDARNGNVILPLSDEEFLKFIKNKEIYLSQEYCLSLGNLGNRGIYLNRKPNPKGFNTMVSFLEDNL